MAINEEKSSETAQELWKWSREAAFYEQRGQNVVCQLCPNMCMIRPGEKGICRTKVNHNGKLYSIAYGNPCAIHTDPIEKKPLNHFYPESKSYSIATAGCNFTCLNCQNWTISQVGPEQTRNYDMMPDKVVADCIKNNCKSISYTYSEPVIFYEYMYDTAKLAHEKGIKNVMVSNGYINEKPLRELCKYMDAANIDLKSFDNEIYKKLNSGTLQPVLNTLKVMKEEGVWLEITNLIVPNWTDDFDMITEMCSWLAKNGFQDNPLHFSRFSPLYKLTNLPPTPVATLERARKIALAAGMRYVYIGNVPGSDASDTYCPNCKKMLIDRKGYFISENNITNGSCKFCNQKIAGVWR